MAGCSVLFLALGGLACGSGDDSRPDPSPSARKDAGGDTAGDTGEAGGDADTEASTDTASGTAPEVSFRSPEANATIGGPVTVEVEVADEGRVQSVVLTSLEYGEIGLMERVGPNARVWRLDWNPDPSQQGEVTLRATAVDDSSQTRSATRTVELSCPSGGCGCRYLERNRGVCRGRAYNEQNECPRPEAFEAQETRCDQKDNDCDGTIDEGCPCEYKGSSEGVCRVSISPSGECPEPSSYESSESICDGKDNDCNGIRDEWDQGCMSYRLLGSGVDESVSSLVVDSSDHLYMGGSTQGELVERSPGGFNDAFVVKWNEAGRDTQRVMFGSDGKESVAGLASDDSDRIYAAGTTSGSIDGTTDPGESAGFVARFDTSLERNWVTQIGNSDLQKLNDVAVDGQGGVYAVGRSNTDIGQATTNGQSDAWVVKLDASGNIQWMQLVGGRGQDVATSLAVGSSGTLYVGGRTNGSIDSRDRPKPGRYDAFVARLDTSDGRTRWVRALGSPKNERGWAVTVDSSNRVYMTGGTRGALGGGTPRGNIDIFLVSFASDGSRQWTKVIGSPREERPRALLYDEDQSRLLLGGSTFGSVTSTPNAGSRDAYVLEFDTDGNRTGKHAIAHPGEERLNGLDVTSTSRLFATGKAEGNIEGLRSEGFDAYVVRLE
jgi:hypothetical protein